VRQRAGMHLDEEAASRPDDALLRRSRRGRCQKVHQSVGTRCEHHRGHERRPCAGHSSALEPFGLRRIRGRRAPVVPALPAPSQDGKEGVDGSSSSEGLTLQLRLLVAFSDASPGERCGGVEEAVICRHFSGKRQLSARETVREYRPAVSASLGVGEADAASVVVLTATVVDAPSSAAVFASAAVQTLTDCTVWRPHADQIVGDEFRGERR